MILLAMSPEVRLASWLFAGSLFLAGLAVFLLYRAITLPTDEPDDPPQWWCPTCEEETGAAYYPPRGDARVRCQRCRTVLEVNQRWMGRAANG
mgnify:CR=1 FL=1